MACKCYNSNNYFLPWAWYDDLQVYSNEYNLINVFNRSSYKLLDNDIALNANFLCLSGQMTCCDSANALWSIVADNSGDWTSVNQASNNYITSYYVNPSNDDRIPLWSPNTSGELLSGLYVDKKAISELDYALPTTYCVKNAIDTALNPEFIRAFDWSIPSTVDSWVVWVDQNTVSASLATVGTYIKTCDSEPTYAGSTWQSSSFEGCFCYGRTLQELTLRSLFIYEKPGGVADNAISVFTSPTNIVLKIDDTKVSPGSKEIGQLFLGNDNWVYLTSYNYGANYITCKKDTRSLIIHANGSHDGLNLDHWTVLQGEIQYWNGASWDTYDTGTPDFGGTNQDITIKIEGDVNTVVPVYV